MHFGNLVTSISLIIGTVLFTVLAIGPIVGYLKKQSEAAEMPEPLPEKQGDVGLAADELDELDFYNLEPIWAAAEAWKTGESTLEIAMNEMLNEEERAKEVLKQLVINDEQRAIAALQTWLNPQQAGRV